MILLKARRTVYRMGIAETNNTILVANHNPETGGFFQRSLKARYNIVSAKSTNVAWELVKENNVDLIILDETLPRLGGLQLLKVIKIAYPHIPVIITAENQSYTGCLKAFRNGARDYFSKPYNLKLLLNRGDIILNGILEKKLFGKNFYLIGKSNLRHEERNMVEESTYDKNNCIKKATDYLHKNFREKISKDELCKIACLSPSHFSRVFKKDTGCSYINYLARLRINKAKELLEGGNLNVTEVCFLVGYHDLSNFERVFHKIVGCCPRDYHSKIRP